MDIPRFRYVADRAVLVEFGTAVSDEMNQTVIALDKAIASAHIMGVVEVVPAIVNLLVFFDPLTTDHTQIEQAVRALFPIAKATQADTKTHSIPICYDANLTPDLVAVATATNQSVEDVIAAHVSAELTVSMYGFAPGYAYLSGLPDTIQVPRKTAPLRDVPKGSILIAGPQCLVSTLVMPTGWSIIGRSPAQVMRDGPDTPFLFNVGDTVTFERISRDALPKAMQRP